MSRVYGYRVSEERRVHGFSSFRVKSGQGVMKQKESERDGETEGEPESISEEKRRERAQKLTLVHLKRLKPYEAGPQPHPGFPHPPPQGPPTP